MVVTLVAESSNFICYLSVLLFSVILYFDILLVRGGLLRGRGGKIILERRQG